MSLICHPQGAFLACLSLSLPLIPPYIKSISFACHADIDGQVGHFFKAHWKQLLIPVESWVIPALSPKYDSPERTVIV